METSDTRRTRGVTLADVARAAGVSTATVSRVVHGTRRVDPALKRRVEAEVRQLGYVASAPGRGLARGRTDCVAVVLEEVGRHLFESPLFPAQLRGITRTLVDGGMQPLLLLPESEAEEERALRFIGAGSVDGVIASAVDEGSSVHSALVERGFPVVIIGSHDADPRLSSVVIDERGGSEDATEHLLRSGRRSLAHIAGPPGSRTTTARIAGFRAALIEAGYEADDSRVEYGYFSPEGGRAATATLLERHPDIDGLVVASDWMAVAAIERIRELGRRVPDDIAVVGFDDVPLAASSTPRLSTIRQPMEEMGAETAKLLLDTLSGKLTSPRKVTFPTTLVVRDSSM